jgi:Tfp pilus assembly protein PilV
MIYRAAPARRGLSLLEVIISLAIFLMSITAIGHLITMAGKQAVDASQRNEATRLAQAQLNRVIAGIVPLSSQGDTPFDDAPDYSWSVDAEQQGSVNGLWTVTVKVTRERSDGKIQVALSQMVLDPSIVGSTQDSIQLNTSSATNNGTNTGSNSGSGTTGSGNTGSGTSGATGSGAAPAPKATTPAATAPKTTPAATTPKAATPAPTTTKKG